MTIKSRRRSTNCPITALWLNMVRQTTKTIHVKIIIFITFRAIFQTEKAISLITDVDENVGLECVHEHMSQNW